MIVAVGLAPGADAATGLQLQWDAPPSCPDHEAMLGMIDATLGDVEPSSLRSVAVRGQLVADQAQGFRLELVLDQGRSGVRQLQGDSCQELSEAAALVVAMAIDPRLLERLEQPPETSDPTTNTDSGSESDVPVPNPGDSAEEPTDVREDEGADEPTPTAEAPAVEPRAEDPSSDDPAGDPPTADRSLAFVGRFDGGVAGGPLPGAAAMASLGLGIAGPRWRVEFTGSYFAPRTRASPVDPDFGVRAQLWALGLLGCGEPRVGPVSFPLCSGLLAGAVHAVGVGDLQRRRVASRWVAWVVEPGVVWWARPRLGIAVRARGHAAIARPRLRTEPSGTVFESAVVGGSVRAGLEFRLP